MFKKLFKFWKYRLEIKFNKIPEQNKIEFLANKLVKELNFKIDPSCQLISVWIHGKNDLDVEIGSQMINCKYTGR
ncbi:hypothetical protein [Clostridium sp. AWRP]|uniref:hypothetical protein n=1 Tax=Clostridium sp. AWRP TaxID=2212991 RepID=UPI000FDB309F|nr:hypothetical protein [Clostridium sp. AWRP]AZV58852.1 hypothetical protein DMR38_20955 [Clostridium sp. AWRP]